MAELNDEDDFLKWLKENNVEARLEVILPGKLTQSGERIKFAFKQYVDIEFIRSALETGIALDLVIDAMSRDVVSRVQDEVESAKRG